MRKYKDSPSYPVRLRAAALIEMEGSIVLVFDPVYRHGCWILPGGGAEMDETIDNAIEREVFEETGLTVKTQAICFMREVWETEMDFPRLQKTRKSLEVFFACQYISGEINIYNNPSFKKDGILRVKDCRWFAIDQLPDMIDGYPLYPAELFQRLRSNQIFHLPVQQIFLPPLDSR